jgi:hypothetical protein
MLSLPGFLLSSLARFNRLFKNCFQLSCLVRMNGFCTAPQHSMAVCFILDNNDVKTGVGISWKTIERSQRTRSYS